MPLTASQLFDQGVEHYEKNRYPEAVACFDAAIDLEPELHAAWHNRALARCELGQYPSALADMQVVIQGDPEYAAAYADRGYIYLQSGDPEAALADLDIAVNIEPDNASFLLTRGTIFMQRGQIKRALADFDRALDADPENVEVLVERAALWNRLGDVEGALEEYNAAIVLYPDNRSIFLERARLYAGREATAEWAAADYCRFIHLADVRTFEDCSREVFTFFDKMPAPFLVRRLVQEYYGGNRLADWEALAVVATRQSQPVQLYQDWLELQKAGQQEPLRYNRLLGLFQFYMGDPMAASFSFRQEGVPGEAATDLPDLMSAYYFIESAKRFHEPVGEIILQLLALVRAQRTALMARQSPADLYYAGLIFFANGRLVEAEEFFAAAEAWLPAAYMYLHTLQLMSAEPALITSKIEALRAREAKMIPEQGYLQGFPVRFFQTEMPRFWEPFEHYAHYREIQNALATVRREEESPAIVEIWDAFQWLPEKRDGVEWMIRRENLSRLGKDCAECFRLAGSVNGRNSESLSPLVDTLARQMDQDHWALTLHENPADFLKAAILPSDWLSRLSGLVSQPDSLPIQCRIGLVEYFLQRGSLTVWEALPMYFYIVNIRHSGGQDILPTEIPGADKKMVEWLFDPLAEFVPAASLTALLHWLNAFLAHGHTAGRVDPDSGAPMVYSPAYTVFLQDFLRYLAFQRESAGIGSFDAEYPLKPFFDRQSGRR